MTCATRISPGIIVTNESQVLSLFYQGIRTNFVLSDSFVIPKRFLGISLTTCSEYLIKVLDFPLIHVES